MHLPKYALKHDRDYQLKNYHIYPLREALTTAITVLLAICMSGYVLYLNAMDGMQAEIREGLQRNAAAIATIINGDAHKSFTSKADEQNPAYIAMAKKLEAARQAAKDIRYLYTCIMDKDGKIRFVVNESPQNDNDGDGKPDKAPKLMDLYPDAGAALIEALTQKHPTASKKFYTDRWGSFISGYAPFYDSKGHFVGVVGLDLEAAKYQKRLMLITDAAQMALVIGVGLSLLLSALVWFTRRHAEEINHSRQLLLEDLEIAKAHAENTAKAKSEFLANMSHEIRTPMNAVLGFTKTLLETPLSHNQRDQLETIQEAGNSLITIINEILDISKIEAGKITFNTEDFDLLKAIDTITTLLSSQAQKKGIELLTFIAADVPGIIHADQMRIRQILINLLGNAIKFTSSGGVTLEIIHLEENEETARLQFSVIDTGIGIAADDISKVFDEFAQANKTIHSQFGGTGLGLAISKKLVALMNGDIRVESTLGIGTRFIFDIEVQRSPLCTGTRSVTTKNGRAPRLLVLSDSLLLREVIKRQCESLGADARDGDAALFPALLEDSCQRQSRFDAVIVDYPEEAAAAIKETLQNQCDTSSEGNSPRFIVLTGDAANSETLKETLRADTALTKPLRQKGLLKVLMGL